MLMQLGNEIFKDFSYPQTI